MRKDLNGSGKLRKRSDKMSPILACIFHVNRIPINVGAYLGATRHWPRKNESLKGLVVEKSRARSIFVKTRETSRRNALHVVGDAFTPPHPVLHLLLKENCAPTHGKVGQSFRSTSPFRFRIHRRNHILAVAAGWYSNHSPPLARQRTAGVSTCSN